MTFGIPLSDKEKRYIVTFPELSHGDVARCLNNLFKEHNNGTRRRMVVYMFRNSKNYQELLREAGGEIPQMA
jgi:hypothetical protein